MSKVPLPNAEEGIISRLPPSSNDKILARLRKSSYPVVRVLEGQDVDLSNANVFRSFHHRAKNQMSDCAMVARHLMLSLKKCVVASVDVITIDVAFLSDRLARGDKISLLLATIANIKSGLRKLTQSLCERGDLVFRCS